MIKAKEIMKKKIFSVTEDTALLDAIVMLIENNVAGLPVVDKEGCLKGVITEKDMISLLEAGPKDPTIKVSDFATKNVVSFKPDDNFMDIATCFKKQGFRMVPIVDKNKVVGVIARRDIIRAILHTAYELPLEE